MTALLMNIVSAAVVCLVLMIPVLGSAQETISPSTPEFDEFKIIMQRNIFDPDRSSPTKPARERARERAPAKERISLLGVLIDEQDSVAFFEGSKPEYTRELARGQTIVGYRITKLGTEQLTLENQAGRILLPVGSSLVREQGGDWQVSSEASYQLPSSQEADHSESQEAGNDTGDDSTSELMKQMMERRRRETGQ